MDELENAYASFLNAVQLSGLVGNEILSAFIADFESNCPTGNDSDERLRNIVIKFLGHSILTPWQCGQLMLGRYKGFIFNNFLLRDYLGIHKDRKEVEAYVARDLRESNLEVVIEFTHLKEDLRLGIEPEFSIIYQRRLVDSN